MKLIRSSALAIAVALGGAAVALPQTAEAYVSIGVTVGFAPPPLPVYVQPAAPGPDYLWTPGFWAWNAAVYDYYWVPGVWVAPPVVGVYWTPAWWGWSDGAYLFHAGYWGPQVGFYGGIDYGYGYGGAGYAGGYWQGGHFVYNQAVNNISGGRITRVFNQPVAVQRGSNASFNGPGGMTARPTAQQMAAANLRHRPATAVQARNMRAAAAMPTLRASVNHAAPPLAAATRAAEFKGPGVVKATRAGGPYHPPAAAARQAQLQTRAGHASSTRVASANTVQTRSAARHGATTMAEQGRSPEHRRAEHLGRSEGLARSEVRRGPEEFFGRREPSAAYRYGGPRGGPERQPGFAGRSGPPPGEAMERRGGPPAMGSPGGPEGGRGGPAPERRREGPPHG